MPYTQKTHNFMAGCAHGMKPTRPGLKCPPKDIAKRLAAEGVKKAPKKNRFGFY